jgi:hypothetical protein
MTETGREIVIGNKGADYLSFIVGKRDREDWSHVEIEIRCDGWSGRIEGSFWDEEITRFASQIRDLHRNLSGIARLDPREPYLRLTLTGDGKGHITVEGEAVNRFESGTKLRFRFAIDQTYLKQIADSLSVEKRH